MIDQSQTIYYIVYGLVGLIVGITYLKIKSTEGITITTNEFKLFQSSFLTGYCMMILGELMSNACFFHTFLNFHMNIEQITKLYIVTVISTTIFGILVEVIDAGSRKTKCVLSSILYTISMISILFGGHMDLLLMGRIVYGAASAIHHSAFDSYVIHEHTSQGFPDDWLSQTFTYLTHAMTLVTVLSGTLGQTAGSTSPLGTAILCCIIFGLSGAYIAVAWTNDSLSSSKFMLSQFLQNMSQTIQASRANKQLLLLIGLSSLCESAVTVITYYWAPWLYGLVSAEVGRDLPYEIIYSTFISAAMLGNYGYQMWTSGSASNGTEIFQILLIVAAGSCFLGCILKTASIAFISALMVQLCVGCYWPCVGTLRGGLVMPELRASVITICRVFTLIISCLTLTLIHYNTFLTLLMCTCLFAGAAYLQSQLQQQTDARSGQYGDDDLDYDDSES